MSPKIQRASASFRNWLGIQIQWKQAFGKIPGELEVI